jgi:hypothetical protein
MFIGIEIAYAIDTRDSKKRALARKAVNKVCA